MSFLKRLFSTTLRRAREAEAAGELEAAARLYARADEPAALARVHGLRAQRVADPWQRIGMLRDALAACERQQDEEVWAGSALALAQALDDWVDDAGVVDRRDRTLLREAGELWQAVGRETEAGAAFARGGFTEEAAQAYTRAGAINELEDLYQRDEAEQGEQKRVDEAVRTHQEALAQGDFPSALQALQDALESPRADAATRDLYQRFVARLPQEGAVRLTAADGAQAVLLSGQRLTIGRDPTCDIVLALPGVSRQHAALEIVGENRKAVDLESRHGTAVNGLACRPHRDLEHAGVITLGTRCRLGYEVHGDVMILTPQANAPLVASYVWGHAVGGAQVEGVPAALRFRFETGYWQVEPVEGLLLDDLAIMRPTVMTLGATLSLAGEQTMTVGKA